MEGGPFSEWGSHLGASHIRVKSLQQLHGWRAPVFKMGLSPWCPAHSSEKLAAVTRMEGGPFSKWGSRLGAADIRLKSLQPLHALTAARFQNKALALAPRTFVLKLCNNCTDGGQLVFKMGLSPSAFLINVRPTGRLSFKGARPGVRRNACIDL